MLVLASCSSGPPDVASLDKNGSDQNSDAESQPERAKAMVRCLNDAGIPAKEEPWEDEEGQIAMAFDNAVPHAYNLGTGHSINVGDGDMSEEQFERNYDALIKLAAKYDPSLNWEYSEDGEHQIIDGKEVSWEEAERLRQEIQKENFYLIVDQTDHTEAFVECLDQTGYTEPTSGDFSAEAIELPSKQMMFASAERWIKCARQNGYPNLADPTPAKADNYQTFPEAILPGDMLPAELRTLLAACPNFDPEQYKALEAAFTEVGEHGSVDDMMDLMEQFPGAVPPQISFDIPGIDMFGFSEDADVSPAERARVEELLEILGEAEREYYGSVTTSVGDEQAVG
jgi:hypothetical protein